NITPHNITQQYGYKDMEQNHYKYGQRRRGVPNSTKLPSLLDLRCSTMLSSIQAASASLPVL
ncbi:hypothetical protein E4U43_006443, partial [Claviceps pusilla]